MLCQLSVPDCVMDWMQISQESAPDEIKHLATYHRLIEEVLANNSTIVQLPSMLLLLYELTMCAPPEQSAAGMRQTRFAILLIIKAAQRQCLVSRHATHTLMGTLQGEHLCCGRWRGKERQVEADSAEGDNTGQLLGSC